MMMQEQHNADLPITTLAHTLKLPKLERLNVKKVNRLKNSWKGITNVN
jgi:hypothetical protein